MKERWKGVVGYEEYYQVSNLGRLRTFDKVVRNRSGTRRVKRQFLKPIFCRGYYSVNLYKNGRAKIHKVHKLVLLTFVGPRPKGMWARHFPDRDTSNNALTNLKWDTPSKNQQDKTHHGTMHSKLSVKEVRRIRALSKRGFINKILAEMFEVDSSQISRIVSRKSWSHIT